MIIRILILICLGIGTVFSAASVGDTEVDLSPSGLLGTLVHNLEGDSLAQYHYALMLANGQGGAPDPAEARIYYKLSADQGDAQVLEWIRRGVAATRS